MMARVVLCGDYSDADVGVRMTESVPFRPIPFGPSLHIDIAREKDLSCNEISLTQGVCHG